MGKAILKAVLSGILTMLVLSIGTVIFFNLYLDYLVVALIILLIATGWWCMRHQQKAIGWGIFLSMGVTIFILAIAISGMNYAR